MKVLYDVNVLLDVFLVREPFYAAAVRNLAAAEQSQVHGFLCSASITTIYYLAAKQIGSPAARQVIQRLLHIFTLAPVDRLVVQSALQSPVTDFEDAILCASAEHANIDSIVTRDIAHFRFAPVKIYSPDGLVIWLSHQGTEE